jgi:hypothetical protein
MASLKADFDELMRRVEAGREFAHASFEPIFYLVFSPRETLEVKRLLPAWMARLRNDGWQVEVFSIAVEIERLLSSAPMRKIWLDADRKNPLDWARTNTALANALTAKGQLQGRLETRLTALERQPKTIVLVTDLEALHPYLRIGAIEAQLQGKFHVPTVFFYPGIRTGKTRLRFLGFYPEDGNYRSVHVGG